MLPVINKAAGVRNRTKWGIPTGRDCLPFAGVSRHPDRSGLEACATNSSQENKF